MKFVKDAAKLIMKTAYDDIRETKLNRSIYKKLMIEQLQTKKANSMSHKRINDIRKSIQNTGL